MCRLLRPATHHVLKQPDVTSFDFSRLAASRGRRGLQRCVAGDAGAVAVGMRTWARAFAICQPSGAKGRPPRRRVVVLRKHGLRRRLLHGRRFCGRRPRAVRKSARCASNAPARRCPHGCPGRWTLAVWCEASASAMTLAGAGSTFDVAGHWRRAQRAEGEAKRCGGGGSADSASADTAGHAFLERGWRGSQGRRGATAAAAAALRQKGLWGLISRVWQGSKISQ